MSCREYYTCKNCGFTYMDVNYYFCFRNDTGVIEKYESLFSTVNYSAGSILRGRVIQHYCKNCDKTVSIYQTGLDSSIFSKKECTDFLKEYIPKKQDKLLKTSVLFYNLVDLVKCDASLNKLNNYLKEHDKDFYYKIDLDDYLNEKSFESMDFYIKDYVKKEKIEKFNRKSFNPEDLYVLFNEDLNNLHLHDLDLKSLYKDLSNHLNGLSAKNLNRGKFYQDISKKFDLLGRNLIEIEREIPCINYYGDDFNITLDGKKIPAGVCPQCGEEFYILSPNNPCPKCGRNEMDYDRVFYD